MTKIVCSKCQKSFDTRIEYQIHYSHSHYGPVPAPLTQPSNAEETPLTKVSRAGFEPAPAEEPKDEEAPYSLATSGEGLGELYPVLMDAHGNVIDGFHRLGENPNWHSEVRLQIDTPVKLQLAMLAVNFARRSMASEEITQRITFLVKAGLKPEEIAKTTGINERTIYKHMPQELKDAPKVEQGGKRPRQDLTAPRQFTNVKAPTEPASTSPTSSTPSTEPKPKETVVPESEEEKQACPCCNSLLSPDDYELVKTEVAIKYGRAVQQKLFPKPDAEA